MKLCVALNRQIVASYLLECFVTFTLGLNYLPCSCARRCSDLSAISGNVDRI